MDEAAVLLDSILMFSASQLAFNESQQLPVELERLAFNFQRFAQHRANVMLVRLKKRPDGE